MVRGDVDSSGSIRALDRAVLILELFRDRRELTMTEIARTTGLSEPTVFRYLGALAGHGWLVQQPTGAYRLGIAVFQLGQRAVDDLDIRRVARPRMEALLGEYGETVNLAIRQSDTIVVIESLESPSPIRRGASVGEQDLWFSSGLGKSILASLPEEEVLRLRGDADIEPLTDRTLTSVRALLDDLTSVRARGYSLDDEESEIGLMCVAAAIHDRHREPRYALSVAGPTGRIQVALSRGLGQSVSGTAAEIAMDLGYTAGSWQTAASNR